jgi:SH3-like domain-containing protein
MQSRTSLLILVILISSACVSFGQEAAEKSVIMTSDPNKTGVASFPYAAQITGDNVNIRSGPGTQYYPCGRLNKGDKVKVVSERFGWSRVVPPAGSFSWISTQFVLVAADDATVGAVTGDNVRVWVGANNLRPMYSTTWLLKLNKGEKVKLLGEEQDKYYKIVPPTGAYRWVSTQFTKPVGSVEPLPSPPVDPPPPSDSNEPVPTDLSLEARKLKEYYALEKQIEVERAKALDQQNYKNIKAALLAIANRKAAGKAARYADFAVKQIERYELSREVAEAVRLQDAELQRNLEAIENSLAIRLADMQDIGRFAAVGELQKSGVYGLVPEPIHYRIIDPSGKTVCYALAKGAVSKKNLAKLVGRKVGLVGRIEPHLATKSALVRFTEVVELK